MKHFIAHALILIAAGLSADATPCDPPPAGIVAWWPAEGNAVDNVGTNNGTLPGGASFAPGEVGQAFSLNGTTGYIFAPASPSLDVGSSGGLTIEGWINSPNTNAQQIIVEWHQTGNVGGIGVHMQTGTGSGGSSSPGALYANIVDTGGSYHFIWSDPGVLATNQFQHVALTYDGGSGTGTLYVNGAVVAQSSLGTFTPQTSYDFYIGERPGWALNFAGLLDEISLYNRALSQSEIAAIYGAGSSGKCPQPPTIVSQPTNQTVYVNGTATFQVVASGPPTLTYQWNFNGTNVTGATNATLTLAGVQLSNAGNYTVLVADAGGATNSTTAVLTVNPTPPCDPAPAGIVAWWAAEGNALDGVAANNGILQGGASFAPGEVGQAFSLDGSTGYVFVPASPSLDVGSSGGLTVEGWISSPTTNAQQIIVEWHQTGNGNGIGVHMQTATGSGGSASPGALYANIVDTGGSYHFIWSDPGVLATNQFQHVALTYDGSSGTGTLYVNGTMVAQSNLGIFTPQTSYDFYLGERPGPSLNFAGLLDEISLYNRALSQSEITAICLAGSVGKCPLPPTIVSPPANQTVNVNSTATLQVVAAGSPALTYQWSFNGVNLANATNTTLTLSNVQLTNTGNYSVTVANGAGTTNAGATLTVIDILDHFAWSPVASPRFANAPFGVTIQAMDPVNQLFTNYNGAVSLTTTSGVPVNPPSSGNFAQGMWTGPLAISQTASNLVLEASDGGGHVGLANPISVVSKPSLAMANSGGSLFLLWPMDPAGFSLEYSTNLARSQWLPVTSSPLQIRNQWLEPAQIGYTNRLFLYRLRYTLPY